MMPEAMTDHKPPITVTMNADMPYLDHSQEGSRLIHCRAQKHFVSKSPGTNKWLLMSSRT